MRSRAKSIRSKTREDFMKKTQLAENEKKMYLAKRRMSKDIRDLEQFKIDFDTDFTKLTSNDYPTFDDVYATIKGRLLSMTEHTHERDIMERLELKIRPLTKELR